MRLVRFKTTFLVLTILAALVAVGSVLASSLLTRDAVYAQLAEKLEAAELFGDSQNHVSIGNPQHFLAFPQAAFMQGTGDNGAKLVDNTYLKKHSIYPFQVKTVEFIRNVLVVVCILGGALMWFLWRRALHLQTRLGAKIAT